MEREQYLHILLLKNNKKILQKLNKFFTFKNLFLKRFFILYLLLRKTIFYIRIIKNITDNNNLKNLNFFYV